MTAGPEGPGSAVAQAGAPEGAGPPKSGGRLARTLGAVPPPGLVIGAIVSIQVGAAIAIHLFPALGPEGTVFLRVALSALLLLLVWRPRIDERLRRHAAMLLAYGAVLATMNLCFYLALARIPLGTAVTIEFIGPLGLAVALSRRLLDLLWAALAAFGLALLAPDLGAGLDGLGVGLALLAGASWAGFILLSKRVGRVFPGGNGLALGMSIAAVLLMPFGLAGSAAVFAEPWLLLAALGVALLSTTIPLSLEFEALKRLSARAYGVLIALEPAVAALVGALLLDESLGARGLLAVVCVTAAAMGVTIFEARRRED